MPHPTRPNNTATPQRLNGFGFAALSLGLSGLVLFFWQPLGLVISLCGCLIGVLGCVRASLLYQDAGLRYSLGGTCLSLIATILNLAAWFGGRSNFQRPF